MTLTRHRELPSSEGLGVCLYDGIFFIPPAPFKRGELTRFASPFGCRADAVGSSIWVQG